MNYKKQSRKVLLGMIFLLLVVGLVACNNEKDTNSTNIIKKDERDIEADTYQVLNNLIHSPIEVRQSKLVDKDIRFTALIISEAMELEIFDEEENAETGLYQYAQIARNTNGFIIMKVDTIEDLPDIGEYVKVNGKITGYISFEEEGRFDDLEITVSSFEPLEIDENIDVDRSETIEVDFGDRFGEFTFSNVYKDKGTEEYLVLVFDFLNTKDKETKVPINQFTMTQGENMFFVNEDKGIASSSTSGMDTLLDKNEKIEKDEKITAYKFLSLYDENAKLSDEPLVISLYNDDFTLIYEYEIELE